MMQIWLFCIILLGGICCRVMKILVLFEDGLKLGYEKGAALLSSDSSFEDDIDNKLDGKKIVYGIKDDKG